jgi:SAM-dependent methyltransferase
MPHNCPKNHPNGSGTDQSESAQKYQESTIAVLRRHSSATETRQANRRWWDAMADEYQAEHGSFLGDADFVWGPEGLREAEVGLLGELAGRRILEIGCGAAQCARWLVGQGADVVAFDLSARQLRHARRIDATTGIRVRTVQADAQCLPFRDGVFDLACSAYGAIPFVADSAAVMCEVARILRPAGRWVFSTSHPFRWCFPDDAGQSGLIAGGGFSYFDRRPYVEQEDSSRAAYVEHHRTLGDRIREITAAGLILVDLVEPEWPEKLTAVWGGWSPLRGEVLPGTAIFVCTKPH